jgi:hypothetical protein
MTEQNSGADLPNGFEAHLAITALRQANRTLSDFFGLSPDVATFFAVVQPEDAWYRDQGLLQFVDLEALRDKRSEDVVLDSWVTVVGEVRRGGLVYLCLDSVRGLEHLVVYETSEVRDPKHLEQLRNLYCPKTRGAARRERVDEFKAVFGKGAPTQEQAKEVIEIAEEAD